MNQSRWLQLHSFWRTGKDGTRCRGDGAKSARIRQHPTKTFLLRYWLCTCFISPEESDNLGQAAAAFVRSDQILQGRGALASRLCAREGADGTMSTTKLHLSLQPSMLAILDRQNDLALPTHRHIDRQKGTTSYTIRLYPRTNHRCTHDFSFAMQTVCRLSADRVADEQSNRKHPWHFRPLMTRSTMAPAPPMTKTVATVRSNHAMFLCEACYREQRSACFLY